MIDLERPIDPWRDRVVTPDAEWYTSPPPSRQWLLRDARGDRDGVLPLGVVGMLCGAGGSGKTMALVQLAIAVATGTTWVGSLDVASLGRVLLLLGEEDAEEARRRVWRAWRASGAPRPDVDSILIMPLAGIPCALVERDPRGEPIDSDYLIWLRAYVRTIPDLRLVVGDPLSRLSGLDAEKDNALATRAVQALESLTWPGGPTVLVGHHTAQWSRGGSTPGSSDARATVARGVTGLTDGVRWVASMTSEHVEGVDPQLAELAHISPAKSNYSRMWEPIACRRDREHGGALVPLDTEDLEIIRAARQRLDPTARRASERAVARTEREERQASALDARGARVAERRAAEDTALVRILGERPGIGTRELRGAMAAALAGCGKDALTFALARLGDRVRIETRGVAQHHYLVVEDQEGPCPLD